MAFKKKTWVDRISEYPTRRRLKKTDGTSELVTVSREEGTISKEGDAFSAANMNDLEKRIADEFDNVNNSLAAKASIESVTEPIGGTMLSNPVTIKYGHDHTNKYWLFVFVDNVCVTAIPAWVILR